MIAGEEAERHGFATRPPTQPGGLGTVTVHIDPRPARVVRQANCFQSIFGSQTSFDFIIWSQVTSLPV